MKAVISALLCLWIAGCWYQDEIVAVDQAGNMRWLVVAEPYWEHVSEAEVKADLARYSKQLVEAGWQVNAKAGIKQGDDVVVALQGNLFKVSASTEFYDITARSSDEVHIRFNCPQGRGEKVSRQIKFKRQSSSPKIINQQGSAPSSVSCGNAVYKVVF